MDATAIPRGDVLKTRALVVATAVAAPAALALETGARLALVPPEFGEVRALLRPALSVAAWLLVGVSALTVLAGLMLHRRLVERALNKHEAPTPRQVNEAHTGAFLISASVPQVPTLLSTLTFTFGAAFLPVGLGLAVSSLGVVILGAKVWRVRIERGEA